ncbi:TetR/AcrR family transcriptional regulator [Ktedonobacter robiniae]|uniref:TetR family transcriptional regulator n=1 Tax=Ktedonobacter robiniae TaxID=2778365 RepID=A0ABQ3V5L5_9CHLR|nr:TetR/AcrR family transcriptional regulator [Ktedonobacter robiniae]GHO60198.1 TetR family transcriptional regulator [Ktedonobacter robiniae]
MESSETGKLTQKAALTRQRIVDAALHLFATKGYDQTTMRDIAAAANCSLGLAYRYFASKEELVLELYQWLATQLEEQVRLLPAASIADRFRHLMRELLVVMAPHRLTLVALSGAALNPLSRAGVFGVEGTEVRRRARASYLILVSEARDAPRTSQVDDLATLLYGLQLALVLFWLQDLSKGTQRTQELLKFVHELLGRLRPFLRLPWAAQLVARFVQIVGPLLGREEDLALSQGDQYTFPGEYGE